MDSFRRRIKNGEDVSADFAEAMKKAVARNLESVGTAALYDKSVGNNFLLNEKLIAFAQSRLELDEKKLSQDAKTSRIAQENGTKEDTAEYLRNKATTAAIVTTVKFDEILAATNPILSGFNDGLGLATIALTTLAGAAVVALAAKGGGKAISSGAKALKGVFGKGAPVLPGAGPGNLPGATTVADGAAKASAAKAAESAAKAGAGAAGEAAKSAAKVAAGEAALKTAGATAGKSMLKALPVVGSILSVASAFGRISSGDYIGAALEGGAAVAALVPGPGTAIALALTGAAGAKDVYTALNPDLAKVPESVPAEPPKSVAQPTAPEVPKQVQAPGEAGRGAAAPAAPAAPAAAAPAAAAPAAAAPAAAAPAAAAPAAAPPAPASTASRTAGTMGAYKPRGSVVAAKPAANSATQGSGAPKIEDLFTFGGQTGQRSNFDDLDPAFKTRLVKVAQAYKAEGGTKINVTSALRDQEDQERIYKTWKDAGGDLKTKPTAGGMTTPALPISLGGRPSAHNVGNAIDAGQQAVDINNKIKLKDFGLVWGGTFKKADPVHIQMGSDLSAAKGGITDGPKSGYPATLHGNEIITPLSPNSILEQLGKTPATTEIAGSSSSSTSNTIKEIYSMNTEIMELLAGKLDTMISKLSDSNDTQSKLLMYSRV
jgi:hypothetical protein